MGEKRNSGARANVIAGGIKIVHQDRVRSGEWAALKEVEWTGNLLETVWLDPVNDLDRARGVQLSDHRRNGAHVRQLGNHVSNPSGNRFVAYAHDPLRPRWAHHHISPSRPPRPSIVPN